MDHIKTLLLWLLLAALPLQGYAAASMLPCQGGHGAPARIAGQPQRQADGAAHHHAASARQVAASGHCAMPTQHHQDHQDHPDHCGADAGNAKCSSCAACCVGAATAVPVSALAGIRPAGSEAIPYRVMHVTAHIPGGLERPPHTDFA
jgi:hypothetical protein